MVEGEERVVELVGKVGEALIEPEFGKSLLGSKC